MVVKDQSEPSSVSLIYPQTIPHAKIPEGEAACLFCELLIPEDKRVCPFCLKEIKRAGGLWKWRAKERPG